MSGPRPIIATGANAVSGSYGRFLCTAALVAYDDEIITIVWPSGALLATNASPIEPVAPGRFSTTTGLPKASESFLPMARAKVSLDPPGGEVTTNRIGFDG